MTAKKRLIVALDYTRMAPALAMAKRLQGLVSTVKVGSVLFTAYGPSVIRRLKAMRFDIMLDLKFFDIPSTVEGSCRAATGLGVALLTVHASGEPSMLEAAVHGCRRQARRLGKKAPKVLGVTVLTSVGSLSSKQATAQVLHLAARAYQAGCDGVVASAHEAAAIKKRFARLKVVCPGIRPLSTESGDQKRIATPAQALDNGADWLVIGRPVTEAGNPRLTVRQIIHEMEESKGC